MVSKQLERKGKEMIILPCTTGMTIAHLSIKISTWLDWGYEENREPTDSQKQTGIVVVPGAGKFAPSETVTLCLSIGSPYARYTRITASIVLSAYIPTTFRNDFVFLCKKSEIKKKEKQ